jgi:hypothetical protein
VKVGILGAPRPVPSRLAATAAGAAVVALALPIFLVAGWRLAGWAIGAVLWLGAQGIGLLLARVRPSAANLAASGVLAFGMMARAIALLVVLLVVASSDARLGLAAALVYAAAYTAELAVGVATYFAQEPSA